MPEKPARNSNYSESDKQDNTMAYLHLPGLDQEVQETEDCEAKKAERLQGLANY